MFRGFLKREGFEVDRLHVSSLMKRMVIETLSRRPHTARPTPGHKVYPYLLRGLVIDRPNQVWATDITYIPMARGFIYLTAVIDWFTRRVLSWRVSITLEAAFCIEAVEEALARFGRPEIFNTDQGSQFTSLEFTKVLTEAGVKISMDGKGSWRDNVVVERFWRTIKYEEVYLRAYTNVPEAKAGIGRYIQFFNAGRPHSSLDGRTPDEAYFNQLPSMVMAA
jgi:putative transposase